MAVDMNELDWGPIRQKLNRLLGREQHETGAGARWGGALGAQVAVALPTQAYMSSIYAPALKHQPSPGVYADLFKRFKHTPETVERPMTDFSKRFRTRMSNRQREWVDLGRYGYDFVHDKLLSPDATRRMPLAAAGHELGHANQPIVRKPMLFAGINSAGMVAPAVGIWQALFERDPEKAKNWVLGSTLASLPMLAAELDASRRGSRAIGQMAAFSRYARRYPGAARLLRLKPFVGVPTHLAGAALPAAMLGVRNWLDRRQQGKE